MKLCMILSFCCNVNVDGGLLCCCNILSVCILDECTAWHDDTEGPPSLRQTFFELYGSNEFLDLYSLNFVIESHCKSKADLLHAMKGALGENTYSPSLS
jgi:hypothetical protein